MSSGPGVIVLGATSAMAEAVARIYAKEGSRIVLAGRNAARLDDIARDLKARGAADVGAETLDLANADAAVPALARMSGRAGGADHIFVFYGVLGDQKRAEGDLAHAREILDVNFGSAAAWCLAAAQLMAERGHGSLVVIGSVAGDRGRQSNYIYGAAKAGLSALVQGIAHRFARQGSSDPAKRLRAVLVKPGFVDTPMTAGFKKGGPLWATPDAIAPAIRKAAERGGPIVYVPWFWRFIMLIIRCVPAPILHKTSL